MPSDTSASWWPESAASCCTLRCYRYRMHGGAAMRSAARIIGSAMKGLFLPVSLILLGQAAASRMLSVQEREVPTPELRRVPLQIGSWKAGAEQTLERNVAEYLKPDDYIIRDYVNRPAHS